MPNRRVVFASAMSLGGHCISASLVTVELLPSEAGYRPDPDASGRTSRAPTVRKCGEEGWRKLLESIDGTRLHAFVSHVTQEET